MINKSKFNLGVIVGHNYSGFLSLDEYVHHFLMPFSPRFRNIDFAIASLTKIGTNKFFVFVDKDKECINRYLASAWPHSNFYVFDKMDLHNEFLDFFKEYSREQKPDLITFIHGDFPVWFDITPLEKQIEKMKNGVLRFQIKNKQVYPAVIMTKDKFKRRMKEAISQSDLNFSIPLWIKQNPTTPFLDIKSGYINPQKTLHQFYSTHIKMLKDYLVLDKYFNVVPVKDQTRSNVKANLARDAHVIDSIIGENVEIHGTVEKSIIFSDVRIAKGAYVKNSLILPGNHIGSGATVINTIIDEYSGDNSLANIEKKSTIGNEKPTQINRDFPDVLKFGVTLIGKDISIPPNTKIGGNCYIESFISASKIRSKKNLPDGYSILA